MSWSILFLSSDTRASGPWGSGLDPQTLGLRVLGAHSALDWGIDLVISSTSPNLGRTESQHQSASRDFRSLPLYANFHHKLPPLRPQTTWIYTKQVDSMKNSNIDSFLT